MKRILLPGLVILILSTSSFGQKGISTGLGLGINSVWLFPQNTYGDPELDYKLKIAPDYIFNLGYNFHNDAGIYSSVAILKLGQKYEGTQHSQYAERDINLQYTSFSLCGRFFGGYENIKSHLIAGLMYAKLNHASQDYLRDGEYFTDTLRIDGILFNKGAKEISDRFQKHDLFTVIGAGIDLYINEDLFFNISINSKFGLTDNNAKLWRIPDRHGEYKAAHHLSSGFNVGFNYLFRTGGK